MNKELTGHLIAFGTVFISGRDNFYLNDEISSFL